MDTLLGYPDRVTEQSDGRWLWYCSIDPAYYGSQLMLGVWACAGIAVFLLLYGAFLSVHFQDWSGFLVILGGVAVFLVITAVVFGLFFQGARKDADPKELYEMTDTYVKTGSGRSSSYFYFRRIRKFTVRPKYLELRGKRISMRVYVPGEDMSFVRNYIMSRLPSDAEIRYE